LSDGSNIVPFTSVVTAAGSAGSIASTADDLVTWAKALYGGQLLSPASLTAMVADVAMTAPFKPSIPYGLGVQAATVDGRPTLGHSGRLLGSRTVVRWLPDQGMAIAVLTNQSRNDPNLVARALIRVVLGTPIECSSCTADR
jgi:CubicO group peptidase (beta-lactamase class C family)